MKHKFCDRYKFLHNFYLYVLPLPLYMPICDFWIFIQLTLNMSTIFSTNHSQHKKPQQISVQDTSFLHYTYHLTCSSCFGIYGLLRHEPVTTLHPRIQYNLYLHSKISLIVECLCWIRTQHSLSRCVLYNIFLDITPTYLCITLSLYQCITIWKYRVRQKERTDLGGA
jgi:hypothetical protein